MKPFIVRPEFDDPDGQPSDVDWGRYAMGTQSRALDQTGETQTALGDPNLWGGEAFVDITQFGQFVTKQLLRLQTIDAYSRNCQVIGTIDARADIWDISEDELKIFLEVMMGVGQIQVTHRFDLRAVVDLAAPWYGDISNGSVGPTPRIQKPWVISGGFIGRAISARALIITTDAPIVGATPVLVQAMIGAFSAGFPL